MLTDAAIKAAKSRDQPYKLTDGQGLHLFVIPAGGKLWRLRYGFAGKEKLLSLGPYPNVILAKAREMRDAAKATLRSGRDSAVDKKVRRALDGNPTDSFEAITRDWHTRQAPTWTERHAADVLESLEQGGVPRAGVAVHPRDQPSPGAEGAAPHRSPAGGGDGAAGAPAHVGGVRLRHRPGHRGERPCGHRKVIMHFANTLAERSSWDRQVRSLVFS